MATWYVAKSLDIPVPSEHDTTRLPERYLPYVEALLRRREQGRHAPLLRFQHPAGAGPEPYYLDHRIKYEPKRVILIFRDPRDVLVSYFHYVMFHKRKGGFRVEAEWHSLAADTSLREFVYLEGFGIRKITNFMDRAAQWAEANGVPAVFYDDMATAPAATLEQFLRAIGFADVDRALVRRAVDEHTFAKMKLSRHEKSPEGAHVRAGQRSTYRSLLDTPEIMFCDAVVDRSEAAMLGRYRAD